MASAGSKYIKLQERLGYKFNDRNLLAQALRHPSFGGNDNQRLEFLGDRVLGLVIANALYHEFPDASEGELAPRFNYLIRKESCANIAENLKIGDEMMLGRSEAMSGGRRKNAILGDAIEALIAAIYLDSNYETARDFILKHWKDKLNAIPEEPVDAKTRLQELIQAKGESLPQYQLMTREGPDHAPSFTVEVKTAKRRATGKGSSKRRAEQHAAQSLLDQFEEEK